MADAEPIRPEEEPLHRDEPQPRPEPERTAEQRQSDHAAIARLADELLPALAAKLDAIGLGEVEVREGAWRVRLRRSPLKAAAADGSGNLGRRSTDRPARAQPGHAGHGHAPAALEGHFPGRPSTNGTQPVLAPVGPGHDESRGGRSADRHEAERRVVATSPAVGVFQPSRDVVSGSRVRAGDALAVVDVLGVPAEVVAPADAIVGATLVEAGEAVEYGQALIELDRLDADLTQPGRFEAGEG